MSVNQNFIRRSALFIGIMIPLIASAVRMNYDYECEYGRYGYTGPDGHYVVEGVKHCTLRYYLVDDVNTEIPAPFVDNWRGDGIFWRHGDFFDRNGDGLIDCFKSVVPGGNYAFSGGHDYGWHTLNGQADFHGGVDIPASEGTIIHNAQDGRVVQADFDNMNGNFVRINHSDGTQTVYIHMQQPAVVQEGQIVTAGVALGRVGDTGHSFGAHLHFQVWAKQDGPRDETKDTRDPKNKFNLNC